MGLVQRVFKRKERIKESEVISLIMKELRAAEEKHPHFPVDVIHASAIVAEEAGELCAAALQVTYEEGTWEHVVKEAIQTAAMGIRFLLNINKLKVRKSKQIKHNPDII